MCYWKQWRYARAKVRNLLKGREIKQAKLKLTPFPANFIVRPKNFKRAMGTSNRSLFLVLKQNRRCLAAMPSPWVDAGAYKGYFLETCLSLFPEKQIHGFEPIPKRARKLQKNYQDPRIKIHGAALGDRTCRARFHIFRGQTISSLLFPLPDWTESLGPRAQIQETITVDQVRLDSVMKTGPGLLKLDVQGSELAALRGAEEILDQIHGIVIELGARPRYRGQPRPGQVVRYLENNGFSKIFQACIPGTEDTWDALFINERQASEPAR